MSEMHEINREVSIACSTVQAMKYYASYHLQVSGARGACNLARPGSDIVDDGPLKPGDHEMSAFFKHLHARSRCSSANASRCSAGNLAEGTPGCET